MYKARAIVCITALTYYFDFSYICFRSHANDIAVQIARTHTGAYDVVVFQDSFHGCLTIGNSISSKMYKRRHVFDVSTTCYDSSAGEENPEKSVFYNKPDWVHVLPIPEEDSFRYAGI